jgi:DNA-binding MarR family transcriptional regulator
MRGLIAHAERYTIAQVDHACTVAIGGRRAARTIAEWSKRLGLTEAEFQILWRLRLAPNAGFDQTSLANALAFSPAQISASIERLRANGRICPTGTIADRRRHHWQLSATGCELLEQMLVAAKLLQCKPGGEAQSDLSGGCREAAA